MKHDEVVMRICVKDYLRSIRSMEVATKNLERKIIELRSRIDGLKSSSSGTGAHGAHDQIAEGIAKLSDLEDTWRGNVARYADVISQAYIICEPGHTERYICWLHWVERMTWNDISALYGYSEVHIRANLVSKGIAEIYELMPESYRRDAIPNAQPL